MKIRQQYYRTNYGKYSSVNRIVPLWNKLPAVVVHTNVSKSFSLRLLDSNLCV